MAEIRKHNPMTSDIGEQVRALMGDDIRPTPPGQPAGWAARHASDAKHSPDDAMFDPFASDIDPDDEAYEPTNVLPFRVGGEPLIGTLPGGFTPYFVGEDEPEDDGPAAA